MLALEDLAGDSKEEVRDHIVCSFQIEEKELDGFEILITYESAGSWGNSSNWFLLRKDGVLYENYGSHCSCNGFEEQWSLEETSVDYLLSDSFRFDMGGYDTNRDENEMAVKRKLTNLFGTPVVRKAAIAAQKARA
jgi:hypothetical protein